MEILKQENDILKLKLQELQNKPQRIESLKKAQKKYYEKNKEKIMNKYKESNQMKIKCVCGTEINKHCLYLHLKTKKHKENMKNIK